MPTIPQIHDDRRAVKRAKKRLQDRQRAFENLKMSGGRKRPGSMKVKTN